MQRRRFTQKSVNRLRPAADDADITIWDESMPGFGVRFRNGGAGHYVIQYKVNGQQGRMSLGHINKVSLDDARAEARKHFGNFVARKVNPTFGHFCPTCGQKIRRGKR